jgi:diguanylate cyclase (GGDEF)-like protein
MRLRTVFLLCFAAASLPAVGWSVWTAVRAQEEWTNAASAVRAAVAMGDALHLIETLSIERGALQERALSDGPTADDLAAIAARDDALLDRAQRSMRAAGLPDEAVTRTREILTTARGEVAAAIVVPLSERDPNLLQTIMVQLHERLDVVNAALTVAGREAERADSRVGALVTVGSLAVEMRGAAGWRSTVLSAWMGGRVLSVAQLDDEMYVTGEVHHAWDRLQRQVVIVGEPPRLAAAIAATREGFFRQAEPRYLEVLAMARAGAGRPMTLPAWRKWTVEALQGTLLARDAAITEAVDYGTAAVHRAKTAMAIAVASMLGTIGLGAGALLVLLRRLVLPVQTLTAAVTRIAGGDVAAEVPERGRHDEIGAMAAAIEVFRKNAVELRWTNLRFDAALSNMSHGLSMYDADERLVVVNPRLCEIRGLPPGSLRPGMTLREVMEVEIAAGHYPGRTPDEACAERRSFKRKCPPGTALDEVRGDRIVAVASRLLPEGGWLSTFEDVTERRRGEARIIHMAHHDALTGLPNRTLFQVRLEEALARSRRGEPFAVLYLDLDRFKAVNDTLGHQVGDALLQEVTQRLQSELRETDTVARLGGDEFAILQTAANPPWSASILARRLIMALGAPYEIAGHPVNVGVSIGIAVATGEADAPATLLKNADLALYRAKADGRGTWRFFELEMDASMQARRLLELDLRRAVAEGQFEVHYQPVLDAQTRRITGFEALVRWCHPERGFVLPTAFIPLAEEIGLIGPITEWVLNQACSDAKSWPDDIRVAVNLSAVQIRAGRSVVDMATRALRRSGLPSARLELEVTETAMLHETETTLATLHLIQTLGIAVALDDFGTGFSSLSHLRLFPFDRLKIDQLFVGGLGLVRTDCAAIVRAVMDLCAGLGIAVTAEGVETEAQLAWLIAEGPVEAQGYLFSAPVPAEMLPALIAKLERDAARADAIA